MWEPFLEWCADVFGVTMKSRFGHLVVLCAVIFFLGLVLMQRWGIGGWVPPALIVIVAVAAAVAVASAREEVWRAACLDLDDRRQRPKRAADLGLLPPTATALHRLAAAVDDARRGRFAAANERLPQIARDLLRPEEVQLLDAVRAMVSLGLGDARRAAQQAVAALPTGSDELDALLGRAVIAEAWDAPDRLSAIERAWARAGIADSGALARLTRLTRLRFDTSLIDELPIDEARALADEARAIGHDGLAAELDARGRHNAYR